MEASTYPTDGLLPVNNSKNNNNELVRNAIEAKALLYLFSEDKKNGRATINMALHYFETLKIDYTAQDISREIGRAIVTGSMVYDWCYPLLTEKNNIL
jgi:heparin/heparan-sulfate lyase